MYKNYSKTASEVTHRWQRHQPLDVYRGRGLREDLSPSNQQDDGSVSSYVASWIGGEDTDTSSVEILKVTVSPGVKYYI